MKRPQPTTISQAELLHDIKACEGERVNTFTRAVSLFLRDPQGCIVETGTYRGLEHEGKSTLILSKLGTLTGSFFYSIDIDRQNVMKADELLRGVPGQAVVCADSVAWLSAFEGNIGFLYLDSMDCNAVEPAKPQRHQLAEIGAAFAKLTTHAIVLLDDCCPGGKGDLSSAFLLDCGFTLVADGYQKLFQR